MPQLEELLNSADLRLQLAGAHTVRALFVCAGHTTCSGMRGCEVGSSRVAAVLVRVRVRVDSMFKLCRPRTMCWAISRSSTDSWHQYWRCAPGHRKTLLPACTHSPRVQRCYRVVVTPRLALQHTQGGLDSREGAVGV